MKYRPQVSVVILNWNGLSDTLECLQSFQNNSYKNTRIIVVDNNSSQDPTQIIKEKFPEVTVIRNEYNGGYAIGNNVGIRYALKSGAAYVWVLNNDTVVFEDTIFKMVLYMEKNPDIGLSVPTIYDYKNTKEKLINGGKVRFFGNVQANSTSSLDYISGAAMFVRKEVFTSCGLISEEYFMFYEDVDYSTFCREKGWGLGTVDDAKILHKEGASAGKEETPFAQYYSVRNKLNYLEKFNQLSFYVLIFTYPLKLLLQLVIALLSRSASLTLWKTKVIGYLDFLSGVSGNGSYDENRVALRDIIKKITGLPIIFALYLLLIPLYPKISITPLPGSNVPIRLDDILFLILAIRWIKEFGFCIRFRGILPKVMFIYISWLTFSSIINWVLGSVGIETFFHLFKHAMYLSLFYMFSIAQERFALTKVVFRTIKLTLPIVVAVAILEKYELIKVIYYYGTKSMSEVGRLVSTVGDFHQLAMYLSLSVILLGVTAPKIRKINCKHIKQIFFYGISLYMIYWVLFQTHTRSSIGALMGTLLLMVFLVRNKIIAAFSIFLLVIVLIIHLGWEERMMNFIVEMTSPPTTNSIEVLLEAIPDADQPILALVEVANNTNNNTSDHSLQNDLLSHEIDDIEIELEADATEHPPIEKEVFIYDMPLSKVDPNNTGGDLSLLWRLNIEWPVVIERFKKSPIAGSGVGAFGSSVDGYYVRVLGETGIVGMIIFITMISFLLMKSLSDSIFTYRSELRLLANLVFLLTVYISAYSILIDGWVASRFVELYWPLVGIWYARSINT